MVYRLEGGEVTRKTLGAGAVMPLGLSDQDTPSTAASKLRAAGFSNPYSESGADV